MNSFDPLNATEAEQELMVQGYLDGISRKKLCQDSSVPYRHGYRVGRNDALNQVESFQIRLAREYIERGRADAGYQNRVKFRLKHSKK